MRRWTTCNLVQKYQQCRRLPASPPEPAGTPHRQAVLTARPLHEVFEQPRNGDLDLR